MIGTRLAALRMGVYVATEHRDRLDPDRAGTEARWVSFDDTDIQRSLVQASGYPDLPLWGGFSSLNALMSALRHGYGVGLLPRHVGDVEPWLTRLRLPEGGPLGDLWLLSHPDLRSNARLRACRQAIVAGFERHAARFEG